MEYSLVGWPDEGPQLRLDHREFSYAGKFVMSNTGKAVAREDGGKFKGKGGVGDKAEPKSRTGHGKTDEDGRTGETETGHGRTNEDGTRDSGEGEVETGDNGVPQEYADDSLVAAIAFNEDRTDPETAWLRYVTVRRSRRGEGVGARLARFAADRLRERGYDRVKIAVNNPFAYQALYKAGFGFTTEETGLAELILARPGDRSPERYRAGLDVYRERDDLAPEEQEFLDAKAGADPPDAVAVPK